MHEYLQRERLICRVTFDPDRSTGAAEGQFTDEVILYEFVGEGAPFRLQSVLPLSDETLRDYLKMAFGVVDESVIEETMAAAISTIGAWVDDHPSVSVTFDDSERIGDCEEVPGSVQVVVVDRTYRNVATVRIDFVDKPK